MATIGRSAGLINSVDITQVLRHRRLTRGRLEDNRIAVLRARGYNLVLPMMANASVVGLSPLPPGARGVRRRVGRGKARGT
ncbi:MAG: hypothetical protein ACRDS1_01635 [Pseudonocardiaceae bacterium]